MSKDSPTIMVVEDETLLLQAITKKLKLSGMDVLSCASGQQAVDYLTSMDELPDAVWLDYYLKDMNGLAFMQELKAKPEWSAIPVIVVSNSASPDKVSNMLALGAKKYILKAEYRLDEIIGMIKEFMTDDGGASAKTSSASVAAPAAVTSMASEPVAAQVASVPDSSEPAASAAAAPVVVNAPAATAAPAETPATSLQAASSEVQSASPGPAGVSAPASAAADPTSAAGSAGAATEPADDDGQSSKTTA